MPNGLRRLPERFVATRPTQNAASGRGSGAAGGFIADFACLDANGGRTRRATSGIFSPTGCWGLGEESRGC